MPPATATMPFLLLADAVLVLHLAVVAFVVGGLPAIVLGHRRRWAWVLRPGLRILHAAAIGVVALQAWLGRYCPLTTLESWLREQAGEAAYGAGFLQHWLQRLLYFEAPLWAFALAYTGFALLVAAAWCRYPPRPWPG